MKHTPKTLADVLEKDYAPGGKSLFLAGHEWEMVISALKNAAPQGGQPVTKSDSQESPAGGPADAAPSGPNSGIYIARRNAFAQAIEACRELIRDYEGHKDHDGNVNGLDFNAMEIEAVLTAIVRIESIEARKSEQSATDGSKS